MESRSTARSRRFTARNFKSGMTLWLVLWCVLCRPLPVAPCPRLCVCYPSPMTVSCQSQNFTSVPAGIPFDSQRVFLQNNRITELRADSFGFETQVLWLYSNNISSIEAGAFSELRELEELDLGDNPQLTRLSGGAFRGLERLQALHMHRCGLSTLPHDLFHKLYSLQFLYLQENQLHHLQDDLFSDLVNLTHLFLHSNRIRVLSENVFRGLVNLDRLLLHENRVRQVNRKAFRDLGRLTILFLFNNSLAELPGQVLRDTSSVQFLRLNGNPWSCGCEARPLWEYFRKTRVSSSELVCSSPSPKRGLDLRFLREMDFATCPLPDPGSLAGTTTTTFSTKTRWWFSKAKPVSNSKGIFGKTSETFKAFPFSSSSSSPVKPLHSLPPSSSSSSASSSFPSSKYEMGEEEAALPKIDVEEYWANYGSEDASSVRCFELECPPGFDNPASSSAVSSHSLSPSPFSLLLLLFRHPLPLAFLALSLHLLYG